jgi:hypothetical protein
MQTNAYANFLNRNSVPEARLRVEYEVQNKLKIYPLLNYVEN